MTEYTNTLLQIGNYNLLQHSIFGKSFSNTASLLGKKQVLHYKPNKLDLILANLRCNQG